MSKIRKALLRCEKNSVEKDIKRERERERENSDET